MSFIVVYDACVLDPAPVRDLLLELPVPEDRHVLAAAIKCYAQIIVTINLKDFPAESLDPYGIEAMHPDEFIEHQFGLSISSRVAYVRKRYGIDPPDEITRDDGILNLAQAIQYSGVSDTTLMKLIRANILAAEQVAPYAPLEIKRDDLDSEPVLGILKRLKATGKLILEGDQLCQQQSLFDDNQ